MAEAKIAKGANFLNELMMGEPQHKSSGHVFQPDKLQIPCMIIDVKVAQPMRGGVDLMVNDCLRNVKTFPAGELGAKIHIGILVVKKKIFIQKANLIQHLPPIKRRCTTGAKHGLLKVIKRTVGMKPAIKPNRRCRDAIPGAIDLSGPISNQLGSTNANSGVINHRFNQILKPPLIRSGVIVNQSNKLPFRYFQPGRIPPRKSPILRQLNDPNAGKTLPDQTHGRVPGTVVNQDNLAVRIGLLRKRLQAILEQSLSVPINHDDADSRSAFLSRHGADLFNL